MSVQPGASPTHIAIGVRNARTSQEILQHPNYKTAYRVGNWPEYEKSLRDRGDVTVWFSDDAINAWRSVKVGKRGGQPVYSGLAIETALTLRAVFHLVLRQTEGFLQSLVKLMDLDLPCPYHTTLSRRNRNGQHSN